MNYITPEEVVTYLPRKIRESESKEELITFIIRGYQELEIPQDKDYIEELIVLKNNHNYTLSTNIKEIKSINIIDQVDEILGDKIYQYVPVYPKNIKSTICADERTCDSCQYHYSLNDYVLTLPVNNSTYHILYNQLYSDNLRIFDDKILIKYLVAYTTQKVLFNNALSSDQTSLNMLQYVTTELNFLHAAARGQVIMKAINLEEHRLSLTPINLTIDEFSNRFFPNQSAG